MGKCDAVSEVMRIALMRRGMDARLCYGFYVTAVRSSFMAFSSELQPYFPGLPFRHFSGNTSTKYVHTWDSVIVDGEKYSIGMTHKQVGSNYMTIIIHSREESNFGITRIWEDESSMIPMREDMTASLNSMETELLNLFSR